LNKNIQATTSLTITGTDGKLLGVLKNELVRHRRFKTRAEAIQAITEYIEIFYKRQRIRAQLGYLSPAVFERQFYEKRLTA